MRIRYVSGTLGMFFTLFSNAQVVSDTIKSVDLSEVVILPTCSGEKDYPDTRVVSERLFEPAFYR